MPIRFAWTRTLARAGSGLFGALLVVDALAAPPRPVPAPAPAPVATAEPTLIRDGFETPRTVWSQEQTDASVTLQTHDRSTRAAHEGRTSEHFVYSSGVGSGFYFSYPLPKVPVKDTLKASVYVRGNRAGVQLFARVVLPSDTDPETKAPSFLLVPGTIYDNADRWQRLELLGLRGSLERQARVLRASTRRPVSLEGAYLEQLVVNLYAGAGETETFLDELVVGPVPAGLVAEGEAEAEAEAPGAAPAGARGPAARDLAPARLDRNRLKKRGEDGLYHDWFFTAIDAPGADLAGLRNASFDVLIDDLNADPRRFEEAVRRGFLLMPKLGEGVAADPDKVVEEAEKFAGRASVFAWSLGDHLGLSNDIKARRDRLEATRSTVSRLRRLPGSVSRLTTGVIDDGLPLFAGGPRRLPMLGVRPTIWGSSVSFMNNYHFLKQRRDLVVMSNAGALFWAILPAVAPVEVPRAIWGQDVPPAWGNPRVQPEQLRLMSYAALAAGYRGLAFKGDAELTRGPAGRMVLLEMALLNAEFDLCEAVLARGEDPIPLYAAYPNDPPILPPSGAGTRARVPRKKEAGPLGEIRAAAVGTLDRKGVLLIAADYAWNAQFQPPQMALNDANFTVIVPEGAQAYEISPGRFSVVEKRERTVGGTRITLPEFDTSALVLVTTDDSMARRVEAIINTIAPRAAQIAIEQAELKLQWVAEINGRLAADGHYLILEKERKKRAANGGPVSTDQADLLKQAEENIKAARENAERLDWANAWSEARRASRPLRMLMRGLWENASDAMVRANTPAEELALEEQIKLGRAKRTGPPLIVPTVASPPLVAFNTLPQHYLWVDWMKSARFGRNLVPSGTFDDPDILIDAGWANEAYSYDGIQAKVSTVETSETDQVHRMVKMEVKPAQGRSVDTLPPYLDQPAAAIRSPAIPVKAGQFLRITVHVRRPFVTPEGAGGLVVRDSIGGEALQWVTNEAIPTMSKLILYRRVPADGDFTVTLGLAGYGDAYFDGLTVERVEAASTPLPPDVARRADALPPASARSNSVRPRAR